MIKSNKDTGFLEEETEEEVLSSFRKAMRDIASGEAIKNARPIIDLIKEFENTKKANIAKAQEVK